MRWTKSTTAAPLLVALVMVLAGCTGEPLAGHPVGTPSLRTSGPSGSSSPNGTQSPGPAGGTLTFGETGQFPTNLLPLILDGGTATVSGLLVRVLPGLFRATPDITYSPDADQGIASSSIVGGKQVVDIRINPRATWADGRPITADDYAFTIAAQRSLDPAKGGCAALLSSAGFEQVERTQKVGDRELRITFRTPYSDWAGMFAAGTSPLLAKHVFDKGSARATCAYITKGWPAAQGIPLGAQNGPWLLGPGAVDVGSKSITLTPNPRYWGTAPRLTKLVHRTVGTDPTAAVTALQNGEIDVAYPLPQADLVSRLKQVSGVRTDLPLGSSVEHLDFNTRDPLLKYPQVRQAIALSFDRRAVAAVTVGQFSTGARPTGNRLLLANQRGYTDNSGAYGQPDVTRAKKLIQSVGGRLGGDGIYRIGSRALTFRVMTTQGNPLRLQTIAILARQARAAGIRLAPFANPDIFAGPNRPTSLAAGGFQIALFAWLGSPAVSSLNPIYLRSARGGFSNYTGGGTADLDALLGRITAATTPDAQRAAANAADQRLWNLMYSLPLYQKPDVLAYRDDFVGLQDNATLSGPLWNSDQISRR